MTLLVETISHGEVESGFYSGFTKLTRLGDYCFTTESLCNIVQYLAQNPDETEAEICGYDISKFWEVEKENTQNLINLILNTDNSLVSQTVDIYLKENQGRLSEDEQELVKRNTAIPISINDGSITIGEYEIENGHFTVMMYYLSHGGWFGWAEGAKPDYAEPTIEAMRKSKNPLFKEDGGWGNWVEHGRKRLINNIKSLIKPKKESKNHLPRDIQN